MKFFLTTSTLLLTLSAFSSHAHHSFAIYDIENKITRTGVLTKFEFSNPHVKLELVVTNEDGSTETWEIESMNPRRWDDRGLPRDMAEVGETVTVVGWPARNGQDKMTISTMTTERAHHDIYLEVRQPGVRDIVPPPTVKRK